MPTLTEFTLLLNDLQNADTNRIDHLFSVVYQELRAIARQQLRKAWSVETICTTALVSEAYLKLVNNKQSLPSDRAHFFAIAATTMRHILINYAEQKQAKKRGGDWQQITINDATIKDEKNINTLLAVNEALAQVQNG